MTKVQVALIGNAVKDPELRYTTSGIQVTNVTLAVSDRRKNHNTGQWEDDNTTFYQAQCWKTAAEHVCQSVRKGDRIIVVGDLRREEWEDKNGQVRDCLRVLNAEIGLSTMFATMQAHRAKSGETNSYQDRENGGYTGAGATETGWVVQDTRQGFSTPQNGSQGFGGENTTTTPGDNHNQPPF